MLQMPISACKQLGQPLQHLTMSVSLICTDCLTSVLGRLQMCQLMQPLAHILVTLLVSMVILISSHWTMFIPPLLVFTIMSLVRDVLAIVFPLAAHTKHYWTLGTTGLLHHSGADLMLLISRSQILSTMQV